MNKAILITVGLLFLATLLIGVTSLSFEDTSSKPAVTNQPKSSMF